MRETSNYKLNQWEKTDRIKMEDFNQDNQKIETALDNLTALCNCQVYLLPYTGTGETGPLTYQFPHRPMFITILVTTGGGTWVCGARGCSYVSGRVSLNNYACTPITWGDRSVSIGNADYDAFHSCNSKDNKYCIVALLDAAN